MGATIPRRLIIVLGACLVACSDEAPPEALAPQGRAEAPVRTRDAIPELVAATMLAQEADREPLEHDVGPLRTSAEEASGGAAEDLYDPASGSPFALLGRGVLTELLPTQHNFARVLEGSDDVSAAASKVLWERGDAREAFEICMQLAATAHFARGYQDREIDRYLGDQRSVPLADEIAPAGAFLRMHLRDRAGFERALNRAHELSKKELWVREGVLDDSTEFSDWCAELHAVLEDTSTMVYEQGIEPYLLD